MSANFRTVLFSGIAVVVGLGVGWWFFRAPSSVGKGKYLLQLWKPLGDGDTSSPIIISDGTIKFRQDDGWTANSATQLVGDLAGFVPLHIKFLACDKNGANCDSAVAFAQDVSKAHYWTAYLCKTTGCESRNVAASMSWDERIDPNTITVSAAGGYTFSSDTGKNDIFKLCETSGPCNVHLLGATLIVNGTSVYSGECQPNTKKCTLKIRYCSKDDSTCDSPT
jgi:hypothetical protein